MIRIARIALVATLSLPALRAAATEPAADVQTRCFQVVDQPGRLMQLRLVDTQDGNKAAFVRYAGAKAWIPLVLSRSRLAPQADSGRNQLDEDWLEIVQDQVAGRYALSMLGNEVVSFDYVNRKSARKTAFTLAPTPRGVDPCEAR